MQRKRRTTGRLEVGAKGLSLALVAQLLLLLLGGDVLERERGGL